MDKKELELVLKEGEGLTIEFKKRYTPRIVEDIVAFSNTRGGFILLGVNDDGKVIGESLTNKMKADINSLTRGCDPHISIKSVSHTGKVVIIEIPEGDEKPYSCSSGYFRRLDAVTQKMSQKELRMIFRETADRTFEDLPHRNFNPGDVSLKRVRAFLKESQTSYKVSKANLTSILASISTYKEGKINNAGY